MRVMFVAGLLVVSACSKPPGAPAQRATFVRVQAASTGPATAPISATGIVLIKDEMRLSFKVSGVVRSIDVAAGQSVRKGQKLAALEQTEIDAQVEQANQMAEKAKRDLARGENLYKDQVISLQQLEDLRTQGRMAQAQLSSARFNHRYASIVAPRDGVVMRKLVEAQEVVPAGQPVLVMGGQDRGYVARTTLSDRDVVQLKLGDRAEIRMDAFPERAFPGTVVELASAANEGSGLFRVEVGFDSMQVPLVTGLVAKLRLYPAAGRTEQLTYVPIGAVIEGNADVASVFIAADGRAKRREVRIAFIAADAIALTSGVQPGESVITSGAPYLEDNEAVEIQK
ncbi:MAG: efflux RND transporter periplasmic adaptor subunit [Steroidobacteraceae bacterium]